MNFILMRIIIITIMLNALTTLFWIEKWPVNIYRPHPLNH